MEIFFKENKTKKTYQEGKKEKKKPKNKCKFCEEKKVKTTEIKAFF